MATAAQIKELFETGDRPTGTNFSALVDHITKAVFHVQDFGALPGGNPQANQSAILAAITAASAVSGTVMFSSGVYEIGAAGGAGTGPIFDFTGGLSNVNLVGGGRAATTLKYEVGDYSTGSDPHMFSMNNCNNWSVRNIRFDGNFQNHTGIQEQMHLFNVVNSDNLQWAECIFTRSQGDGIKFLGNGAQVSRIQINGCGFLGCKRAGVVMQRQVDDLIVTGCLFDGNDEDGVTRGTDQVLDYEPTAPSAPSINHTFTGNIFRPRGRTGFGVGIGGGSTTFPLENAVFSGNIFYESNTRFFQTKKLQLVNNVFIGPSGSTETLFDILGVNDDFHASGNYIESNGDQTAVNLQLTNGDRPANVKLLGNTIVQNGNEVPIKSENGFSGGIISGNRIVGNATMKAGSIEAIRLRDNPTVPTQGPPIVITDNVMDGCYAGVVATCTDDAANGWEILDISGNAIRDCTRGVQITATADSQIGVLKIDNSYFGTTDDIVLSGVDKYKLSDKHWAGPATPSFTAKEGDVYQVTEVSATPILIYASGSWVALSIPVEITLAQDDFDVGADTLLNLHNLPTFINGTVWSLSTAGNIQATASTNEAQALLGSNQAAFIDVGVSDCEITSNCRIVSTSSFGGILLRYTDIDNYWALVVNGSGTEVQIIKRVGGVATVEANQTGLTLPSVVPIQAKCVGDLITVKIASVQLTVQDSFNQAETNVGILSGAASRFFFRDFKVLR